MAASVDPRGSPPQPADSYSAPSARGVARNPLCGNAAQRANVGRGLPRRAIGEGEIEVRHFGSRNALSNDADQRAVVRRVPQGRALQTRTRAAGAVCPVAPRALSVEDAFAGRDIGRSRGAERPRGLRGEAEGRESEKAAEQAPACQDAGHPSHPADYRVHLAVDANSECVDVIPVVGPAAASGIPERLRHLGETEPRHLRTDIMAVSKLFIRRD